MTAKEKKLEDLNIWFLIEIMAFYGYILSAAWFIFEHQIKSTFGLAYVESVRDRYKYDFINYHRKDLDWLAFVFILTNVNLGLMVVNSFIVKGDALTNV